MSARPARVFAIEGTARKFVEPIIPGYQELARLVAQMRDHDRPRSTTI